MTKVKARHHTKLIEPAYDICLRLWQAGEKRTYGWMGAELGGLPPYGGLLAHVLDEVNRLAKRRGLKVAISGVIINASTKRPGDGYYACWSQLHLDPVA